MEGCDDLWGRRWEGRRVTNVGDVAGVTIGLAVGFQDGGSKGGARAGNDRTDQGRSRAAKGHCGARPHEAGEVPT